MICLYVLHTVDGSEIPFPTNHRLDGAKILYKKVKVHGTGPMYWFI